MDENSIVQEELKKEPVEEDIDDGPLRCPKCNDEDYIMAGGKMTCLKCGYTDGDDDANINSN
jgi:hypothetical protein